jgi:hypothetical protein
MAVQLRNPGVTSTPETDAWLATIPAEQQWWNAPDGGASYLGGFITSASGGNPNQLIRSPTVENPQAYAQGYYAQQGAAGGPQTLEALLASVDRNNWAAGLAAIEPQLNALGYSLQKNSAGQVRGRLYRPDGSAYDPFGDYGWVTAPSSGGGGVPGGVNAGGATFGTSTYPAFQPPAATPRPDPFDAPDWSQNFDVPQWTEDFSYQSFEAPTGDAVFNDPGYQFRKAEGERALQASAAARGTLLTGGTLQDLERYSQGLAAQEYGAAYDRELGEYQMGYSQALGQYQQRYGEFQDAYQRDLQDYLQEYQQFLNQYGQDLGEYQMNYGNALTEDELAYQRALQQYQMQYGQQVDAYNRNTQQNLLSYQQQQDYLNNLFRYYGSGQQAASNLASLGQGYAGNLGTLYGQQGAAGGQGILNAGQARASGAAGASNAYSSLFGSAANTLTGLGGYYATDPYGAARSRTQSSYGPYGSGYQFP